MRQRCSVIAFHKEQFTQDTLARVHPPVPLQLSSDEVTGPDPALTAFQPQSMFSPQELGF